MGTKDTAEQVVISGNFQNSFTEIPGDRKKMPSSITAISDIRTKFLQFGHQ